MFEIGFVDGFFGGSNAVQVTQQDITADVHGVTEQWLLEFTDDGNETHQIRYLTPGKAKGKVYVKQADGSWHKVETGSFGSYTTFTTTGTEVEVAFVPAKLPIWAFCAGGAALLVLEGVPPEYFMRLGFGAELPAGTVRYHAAFDGA